MQERPSASKSEATCDDGTTEPDTVQHIASGSVDPDKVGFRYTGEEYGENAWIVCDREDLVDDNI